MSKPVSASAVARELGVSTQTITRMVHAGEIKPEIHRGRLIRIDLAKARKALSKPRKPKAKLPPGMVPTF